MYLYFILFSGSSSTNISTPSTPHDNSLRDDDGQFFLVSASPDNSNRVSSSLINLYFIGNAKFFEGRKLCKF